jgi:hypothetical protein
VFLICGLAAGAAMMALYKHVLALEERIKDLEEASKKHLPYRTADRIEDATAAILKAAREIDFDKSLLENALSHLQKARNNE